MRATRPLVAATTTLAMILVTAATATASSGDEPHPTELSAPTAAETVGWIETITGTDSLVPVLPGDVLPDGTTIPGTGDEAISISGEDVAVSFGTPGEASAPGVALSDGTIHYPQPDEPFDMYLQVVESPDQDLLSAGIRSLIEIEGPDAPREYTYPLDLPEGAELQHEADGGLTAWVGDDLVLVIPAPWALDADGASVPTRYEIADGAVVQVVDFDESTAFPVVADPIWFVALAIVGRAVAQVAINAATRAAAIRIAAGMAARTVVSTSKTFLARASVRKCLGQGAVAGGSGSVAIVVERMGDGRYKAAVNGGVLTFVSVGAGGCLLSLMK